MNCCDKAERKLCAKVERLLKIQATVTGRRSSWHQWIEAPFQCLGGTKLIEQVLVTAKVLTRP